MVSAAGVVVVPVDGGFVIAGPDGELEACFMYTTEPIATPSTARMIKKGRMRFMVFIKGSLDGSGRQCCRERSEDVTTIA